MLSLLPLAPDALWNRKLCARQTWCKATADSILEQIGCVAWAIVLPLFRGRCESKMGERLRDTLLSYNFRRAGKTCKVRTSLGYSISDFGTQTGLRLSPYLPRTQILSREPAATANWPPIVFRCMVWCCHRIDLTTSQQRRDIRLTETAREN